MVCMNVEMFEMVQYVGNRKIIVELWWGVEWVKLNGDGDGFWVEYLELQKSLWQFKRKIIILLDYVLEKEF